LFFVVETVYIMYSFITHEAADTSNTNRLKNDKKSKSQQWLQLHKH